MISQRVKTEYFCLINCGFWAVSVIKSLFFLVLDDFVSPACMKVYFYILIIYCVLKSGKIVVLVLTEAISASISFVFQKEPKRNIRTSLPQIPHCGALIACEECLQVRYFSPRF